MNWQRNLHFVLAASLAMTANCFAGEADQAVTGISTNAPAHRPENWAQPVKVAGIGNCYQVSSNLFRGAQPTAQGMTNLQNLGIKTVINLRAYHSDKGEVAGTTLKRERFGMNPWHANKDEVVGFLKVMADTNNLPAFVHCQRGADRTGMMCAMYRITFCGWTKPEAIAEMTKGGFGFYPGWHELVAFIEKADLDDIKRRAGLSEK